MCPATLCNYLKICNNETIEWFSHKFRASFFAKTFARINTRHVKHSVCQHRTFSVHMPYTHSN